MADFKPKPVGMGSLSATAQGSGHQPEPAQLPEVGDTIRILAHPYGYQIMQEGMVVPDGVKVIEADVTGIKTARVTFE